MSVFHKDSEEIKFKFLSDSVLKAFEQDGRKYCHLTASSNAEDLLGDVMSQKALEQIKSAAVGTSRFWIFDFGFWIGRTRRIEFNVFHAQTRNANEIRNPKSVIRN